MVGFARDNGLGAGAGHRTWRRGARIPGRRDPDQDRAHARRRGQRRWAWARVEAGAWGRRSGRGGGQSKVMAFLPGTSPDVGVTGYTLGGGVSWFGRSHGWACNRVAAIELVTADGHARAVDGDERSRPLLGAARRRRRVRGGQRSARGAGAGIRGLRRGPAVPARAGRRTGSAPIATGPRTPRRRPGSYGGATLNLPPIPDIPKLLRGEESGSRSPRPASEAGRTGRRRSHRCARSASRPSTASTRSRPPD